VCTRVRFVDTSVLLYAISRDPTELAKAEIANRLLSSRDLALSAQVLQEFYVESTRDDGKGRLTDLQAAGLMESFRRFPVQETSVGLALAATDTARRWQISYWSASILVAASLLECDTVLSEDFEHMKDYGDVRVVNPFDR
jgi:predicted nucleic acid-binding protein